MQKSEIIDPTNVMLESGNGSLNGAARTSFVDVPSYDGFASAANLPSIETVLEGTEYDDGIKDQEEELPEVKSIRVVR